MKSKLFLLFIIIGAFFIRIYNAQYPPLTWDEASLGYNAYSISQTLKDEYGTFLPLIFRSFGDYKPGLYVYLAAPFVSVFGLSELSTRLPSIILGTLSCLLIYLLILQFNSRQRHLALIAAAILAFNPFNIHFSRGAWETNILTFQLLLGSYLLLRFRHYPNHRYLLYLSSVIFGLSLYTYQTAKFITPLIILSLYSFSPKKLLSQIKFFIPLSIISLPIFYGLLFGQDSSRLKVVSVFSYPLTPAEKTDIVGYSSPLSFSLFQSDPIFFSRQIFTRYFNHFSPKFLIFEGDWTNPRHSAPYYGVILYPSLIFLIIGFFYSLSHFRQNSGHSFFLSWLLLTPVSSALTRDLVQPVRSMSFSIPLVYLIALGLTATLQYLRRFAFKNAVILFISLSYLLSFLYYTELYFNHLVKVSPSYFTYGYKEAMLYLNQHYSPQKNIIFTDFYGQPYIFYLFYRQYSPLAYQQQASLQSDSPDVGKILSIDNITFHSPDFNVIRDLPNTIAIFSFDDIARQGLDKLSDFSTRFTPLSPINGNSTFYAYEN
jgi:4-amino-4-deoxy-L-arabinose transferase-like glycosyltransferase